MYRAGEVKEPGPTFGVAVVAVDVERAVPAPFPGRTLGDKRPVESGAIFGRRSRHVEALWASQIATRVGRPTPNPCGMPNTGEDEVPAGQRCGGGSQLPPSSDVHLGEAVDPVVVALGNRTSPVPLDTPVTEMEPTPECLSGSAGGRGPVAGRDVAGDATSAPAASGPLAKRTSGAAEQTRLIVAATRRPIETL